MRKLRRFLALLLSCLLVLGIFPAAATATPPDMPASDHWAYPALQAAVANGLLRGDSAGKLNPTSQLTRAETAAVINRAFGSTVTADVTALRDVPENAWYRDDIAKAIAMGIFAGSGDGTMRPTASISRQEAFSVLARAFHLEGADLSVLDAFSDAGSIAAWAKPTMAVMVQAGYVKGSGGKLNPLEPITRQEFAQVMYNMIKTYVNDSTVTVAAEGNVMVNTAGCTLKDLTIQGDLILGDGIGSGTITLENVTVTGRIVVRSGAILVLGESCSVAGDILLYADGTVVTADAKATLVDILVFADSVNIDAASGTVVVAEDCVGTIVNEQAIPAGETVEITQPDPLLDALAAVNAAAYPATALATETEALAYVKGLAEAAVSNSDILVSVTTVRFTAPVAGTLAKPEGVKGELVFTVHLNDGGSPAVSEEKTLVLLPVAYAPQPSVAVTPADPSVAYKGSVTLTAVATDILNPTYQWYCADAADAAGTVMDGKTESTLALTALTETAYYYCMSGTVKSNAVKVTVAENPLTAALAAVNALTYPVAKQADCSTEAIAVVAVKEFVMNAIQDAAVIVTVNVVSYTAPEAGTFTKPAGTDGALVFTIGLEKAGITETIAEQTLTITATAYIPQPSVAVTPADPSVAYKGSVTLTAEATDILEPAYQWYCAETADATGTAIDGETESTLALTDLTETAYYYCMSGEVKSNVVKVTVAENPLKAALAAVNALTYPVAKQADCSTEAIAVVAVKEIVMNAIQDAAVIVTVNVVSYTAPEAGTFAKPAGTDGALIFTIGLEKAGITETVAEQTLTITATAYVPQPSVAVTPADPSVAYKGSVMLTAAVTDILTPTYQWYRATEVDAAGTAIEGATVKALALTDLTETAYYYCMCGTVKSNVVKVTVGENPLAEALSTVNSVTFPAATQARVPSQSAAIEFAEGLLQFVISDSAVTSTLNFISYTAPIAGTFADLDGTNGSLVFTYELAKDGYTETTVEKTLIITATAYIPQPSVAVTPAGSSVFYKGSVMLTAAVTDILEPTYQWYRATEVDAAGAAIEGATTKALALTALTETAYYYCMCGTVKSNVVKVRVGENPLKAALVAVNALSFEAVKQADCADQAAAVAAVKALAEAAIGDAEMTVTVNVVSYTAPIAGTLAKPAGTDGALVFTVELAKAAYTEFSEEKTLTITATAYIAQGTVAVTPAAPYVAYDGSVTLTAVATDILEPTYQWYCATAAEVAGTAIEGETESTLALTKLHNTAYYYCMSGLVKSNVVKVTVAEYPLRDALAYANGFVTLPFNQADCPDESTASHYSMLTIKTIIGDPSVTVTLNTISYTAPIAGTLAKPAGTDGLFVYTVGLAKGSYTDVSREKTTIIKATPYVADPSLAVTPAEASVDYKGDITLTAAATDILNPTYQWYRTATADADGTAMTGETADTLALTDLTETAYYYCMCGTVKSNVVKVTVGENPLAPALERINTEPFPTVGQERVPSQSEAVDLAIKLATLAVRDNTVTVTVNVVSYTAPIAGVFADLDGTDGSLVFTCGLARDGYTETSVEKTLTITATPYIAAPSVAVTPAAPSLPYLGSTTLTAVATDILNPTYQWYCAAAADAEGTAMTGETATTLALTALTETAYYYCMCGTVKSNMVKVTVEGPALQVNGTIYTDLSEALAAAGLQYPVQVIGDYTIAEGATITIGENQLVLIEADATLFNNGTIENKNVIEISPDGTFVNNGTVNGLWHDDEHSDNPTDGWYDTSVTARGGDVQNNGQINDRLALRDLITGTPDGVSAPVNATYRGMGTVAVMEREAEADSENALRYATELQYYSLVILASKYEEQAIVLTQDFTVSDFNLFIRGTFLVESTATLTLERDREITLVDAEFTVLGKLRIAGNASMRLQHSTLSINSLGGLYNNGYIEINKDAYITNSYVFENNGFVYGEAVLDDTSTAAPIRGYRPTGEGEFELHGFVKTAAAFKQVADSSYFTTLWVAPVSDDADLPSSTDADRTLLLVPDYEGQTITVKPELIVGVLAQNGEGQRYPNILRFDSGLNVYIEGGLLVSGKLISDCNLTLSSDAEIEAKHSDVQVMGTFINYGIVMLEAGKRLDCRGDLINEGSFYNGGTIAAYKSLGLGYPQYGSITGNIIEGNCTTNTVVYSQEDLEAALDNPEITDIVLSAADTTYQFPTQEEFTRSISLGAAPNSNITLDLSGLNLSGELTLFNFDVLLAGDTTVSGTLDMTACTATNSATLTVAATGSLLLGADCDFSSSGLISIYGRFNLDGTLGHCRFNNEASSYVENYGHISCNNAEFNIFDWEFEYYQAEGATFTSVREVNRTDLARELVNVLGERLNVLEEPTDADFESYAQLYPDWEQFRNNPEDIGDDDTQGECAMALLLKNNLIEPQSGMILPYEPISRLKAAQLLDLLAQRLGVEELRTDEAYHDLILTDTSDLAAIELARAGVIVPVEEGSFDGESSLLATDDGNSNSLWELLERYCDALGMGSTAEVSTLEELKAALAQNYVVNIYLTGGLILDGLGGEPLVLNGVPNQFRRIHVPAPLTLTIPEGETLRIDSNVELALESDAGQYGTLRIDGTLENMGGNLIADNWEEQVLYGPNGRQIDYLNRLSFADELLPYLENRMYAPTDAEMNDYRQGNEWPAWDMREVGFSYLVKYTGLTQEQDAYGNSYWNWNKLVTYSEALSYYTAFYRAIFIGQTVTLPSSVSLSGVQPDALLSFEMCWELNQKFSVTLPLVSDFRTTTITLSNDPVSYNGFRFHQPITLICENPNGMDWAGDVFFERCNFEGGLTVIAAPHTGFAVELNNSCTGSINIEPYDGQDLRSTENVELRGANGCNVNAAAPISIRQYENATYTLNGVEFTSTCDPDTDSWTEVRLYWACTGLHDDSFWEGSQNHDSCLEEDGTPAGSVMMLQSECSPNGSSMVVSGTLPCSYVVLGIADLSSLDTNGHEVMLADFAGRSRVNIGANEVSIYDAAGGGYELTGSGTVYVYNSFANILLGDTALSEPHIFGNSDGFGVYIPSGNTDLQFKLEQGQWAGEGIPVTEWNTLAYTLDTQFAASENKLHLLQSGTDPWITDPYQVRLSVMTAGYPTVVYDRINHKPECFVDNIHAEAMDDKLDVTARIETYSMEQESEIVVYISLFNNNDWVACGELPLQEFLEHGAQLGLLPAGVYTQTRIILAYAYDPTTPLAEGISTEHVLIY